MYNVPRQHAPTNQSMKLLCQHMLRWASASKAAYDQGKLEEHHQLIQRMLDTQQRIVALFEPPPYTTAETQEACRLVQATARYTLRIMLDYVQDPVQHYNSLCHTLRRVDVGWEAACHLG